MAAKIRNFLVRGSRHYARKVMPAELQAIIGKQELTRALGGDRRTAIANLPIALVAINAQLDHARRILALRLDQDQIESHRRMRPLSQEEIAREHYHERLALDEALRNTSPGWANIGIDDGYVSELRAAVAGKLSDEEMETAVGSTMHRFRLRGNISAQPNSPEWRKIGRAIAAAELEVLERMFQRDQGVMLTEADHPAHLIAHDTPPTAEPFVEPVSLRALLETYLNELEASGRGRAARKAWVPVFEDLVSNVRKQRGLTGRAGAQADDARRLTKGEVSQWRDEKLLNLSPKTVKDVYLASLKAVLNRAVENDAILSNVAALVKVRTQAKIQTREKGFTTDEGAKILRVCSEYVAEESSNLANQESAHVAAAKKWGPWLCAFTGARIGEVLQLRHSDIRKDGDIYSARINPDAGTVKNRSYRDVPLHPQLFEMGFGEFIDGKDGPLFYAPDADPSKLPAQAVAGTLGKWLQAQNLIPQGVQPSHGWRHRFKTVGLELGISERVLDAIQGHAGRTASDGYGDVTMTTRIAAIAKFPRFTMKDRETA